MARRRARAEAQSDVDLDERAAERDEKIVGVGHNDEGLTEDEERALTYSWKRKWEEAEAKVKAATAERKAIEDGAKSELGKHAVKTIKELIALEQPKGNEALHASIERSLRLARWVNAPVGSQFSFFEDRTPAEDRAYALGKTAGLAADPCKPPYDPGVPQYQRWLDGWHDGNAINLSNFRDKLKKLDAGPADAGEQMDLSQRADLPPEGAGNDADVSDPPFLPPADVPTMPEPPDDGLDIPPALRRTSAPPIQPE